MKRYIVADGWGHIFWGNDMRETRWVLDCVTRQLVAGSIMENGWSPLHGFVLADLQEDVEHNVLGELDKQCLDWEETGLRRTNKLPGWACDPAPLVVTTLPETLAAQSRLSKRTPAEHHYECEYASRTPPFYLRLETKQMLFPGSL
ncbi:MULTISPECIES: hypothetical protein [unclassified Rhizobium]|uniref:hypothetical protein n=1 Tax=unclassified Rhizobium TaxID=2613769 RepID=UPI000A5610CA|nr:MULTISPECIES: hypothetical protein [unclassified Rhizobium]